MGKQKRRGGVRKAEERLRRKGNIEADKVR
jgi:hypothetical protein